MIMTRITLDKPAIAPILMNGRSQLSPVALMATAIGVQHGANDE
jgi:hypothetical protein